MKKMIFIFFLFASSVAFAQEKEYNHTQTGDAPEKVRGAFQKDNPQSSNTQWEQRNNQWHASYKDDNNRKSDAYYDGNGNRIETHTILNKKDVPENIDNSVNRKYE